MAQQVTELAQEEQENPEVGDKLEFFIGSSNREQCRVKFEGIFKGIGANAPFSLRLIHDGKIDEIESPYVGKVAELKSGLRLQITKFDFTQEDFEKDPVHGKSVEFEVVAVKKSEDGIGRVDGVKEHAA